MDPLPPTPALWSWTSSWTMAYRVEVETPFGSRPADGSVGDRFRWACLRNLVWHVCRRVGGESMLKEEEEQMKHR